MQVYIRYDAKEALHAELFEERNSRQGMAGDECIRIQ